jgi:anti-anti-sigma factor
MKVESSSLAEHLIKVSLDGRLDIDGARAVEDRFAFLTTTSFTNVIVDLSAVSFLASIGIRMLMTSARGQHGRGGKLLLAGAQPLVKKVLVTAGIDQLIPIFDDVESARASLAAA